MTNLCKGGNLIVGNKKSVVIIPMKEMDQHDVTSKHVIIMEMLKRIYDSTLIYSKKRID